MYIGIVGSLLLMFVEFANPKPVTFRKQFIAMESAESAGVFDVNNDGHLDIVSGSYWYQGPDFKKKHFIAVFNRVGEYFDDFSTIPMDINGDGQMDYVTGGWFGATLVWMENPGTNQAWTTHEIAKTGNVETTRAWDVDGDGYDEIVPNTPNKPLAYYKLLRDGSGKPTGQFDRVEVAPTHGHGLGFGDVNGDGRGDFILSNGWLEAPEDPKNGTWKLHEDFNFGGASIPVLVQDVNGDGLNDLIVGQAHDYGLDWYEQKKEGENITFEKHPIDPFQSQYHCLEWVDIDNDGEMELVTGKRYRAHNGNDPGGHDNLGMYYFKWNGESFTKNVISYGPFGEGKGAGIYFAVEDLNNSGFLDIVVAGKDGLAVFFNEGN